MKPTEVAAECCREATTMADLPSKRDSLDQTRDEERHLDYIEEMEGGDEMR